MEYILAVALGVTLAILSERKFQARLKKIEYNQEELVSLNHRLDLLLQPKNTSVKEASKSLEQTVTRKFVLVAYTRELNSCNYKSFKRDSSSDPFLEAILLKKKTPSSKPKKKKDYPASTSLQHAYAGS